MELTKFFRNVLDLTLATGVVIGGAIGIILVALFGVFIKVLPFIIKLGAIAMLAYFGLSIFGIV